jgi:hypothetical protein
MKYTKYLYNGKFVDVDSIQTEKILFKLPIRLISISVAFMGIAAIIGVMPMAIMIDEYRNTKCNLIHFRRHGYKINKLEKLWIWK